jgi:hypothetical protein
VGVLWGWMLNQGMRIFFAHRTFSWSNEARGNAAVHCVIIGFAADDITPKFLFSYEDVKGEPLRSQAKTINPYLVDGPMVTLVKRGQSICQAPLMKFGNQPIDGGNLILSGEERDQLLAETPNADKFIRRYIGSRELINGGDRYCLWLEDATPDELMKAPGIMTRIQNVRKFRLTSDRAATRELARTPTIFAFTSHEETNFLAIPSASSQNRLYIPIAFLDSNVIASNLCLIVPSATLYDFGILSSLMHNAWMRTVCGRLKSDYRYSVGIVYNNFPWPEKPNEKQYKAVEAAAQDVLNARSYFTDSTLAKLYDPVTMPPSLTKAHQVLDQQVDKAYGNFRFESEGARMSFLFQLYQKYQASPLLRQPFQVPTST